jgi:hypothetical protein
MLSQYVSYSACFVSDGQDLVQGSNLAQDQHLALGSWPQT